MMSEIEKSALLTALVAREGAAAVKVERAGALLDWGRTKAWEGVRSKRIRAVKVDGRTVVPLTEVVRILAEGMADTGEAA